MTDSTDDDPRLIRLAPQDNVVVLGTTLAEGDAIRVGGEEMTCSAALSLGHKIASRAIAQGERVLKYGAPIGVAVRPIAKGEHVHVHNVRSDYTPTYTLPDEEGRP